MAQHGTPFSIWRTANDLSWTEDSSKLAKNRVARACLTDNLPPLFSFLSFEAIVDLTSTVRSYFSPDSTKSVSKQVEKQQLMTKL